MTKPPKELVIAQRAHISDRTMNRLVRVAAAFGIYVLPEDEQTWHVVTPGGQELTLPVADAAHRVLSELCEQTADWIPYRIDESPVKTFERVTNERWTQVVRLHDKRRRRLAARAKLATRSVFRTSLLETPSREATD